MLPPPLSSSKKCSSRQRKTLCSYSPFLSYPTPGNCQSASYLYRFNDSGYFIKVSYISYDLFVSGVSSAGHVCSCCGVYFTSFHDWIIFHRRAVAEMSLMDIWFVSVFWLLMSNLSTNTHVHVFVWVGVVWGFRFLHILASTCYFPLLFLKILWPL